MVWVKLWGAIKKQSENRLYDFCPCSHRGESASSFRNGAIRFCTCLEKQGSHRGHREHGENKHRGVSASSLRGADFQSACLSGNTWERQTLVWHGFIFSLGVFPSQHRGVRALSSRDGAIRFCSLSFPFYERSYRETSWASEVSPLVTPR